MSFLSLNINFQKKNILCKNNTESNFLYFQNAECTSVQHSLVHRLLGLLTQCKQSEVGYGQTEKVVVGGGSHRGIPDYDRARGYVTEDASDEDHHVGDRERYHQA